MKKLFYLFIALTAFAGCSYDSGSISTNDSFSNPGTGVSGSTARFTIAGDYLYIVNESTLFTYSISDPTKPSLVHQQKLNVTVETIFSYADYLLLGTQSGMYVYDLVKPEAPNYISNYQHIVSCDPVVAKNGYAYMTLSTGGNCNRGENRFDVVDIRQIQFPQLVSTYSMENPKGLGICKDHLFICDNGNIRKYDITNPRSPSYTGFSPVEGCFDIIGLDESITVATGVGIKQFLVGNDGELSLLSTITVN